MFVLNKNSLCDFNKNNEPPVEVSLVVGSDGYLRLSDYKLKLGELGVEQGNTLEIYHAAAGIWDLNLWDTPIHTDGKHQKCLVRYKGVMQMPFVTEHLPVMKDE
jgi:hypothetical protein